MTSGLLITAVLMGAVGIPHCLVMCGVPCSITAQACGDTRQVGQQPPRGVAAALQLGRLFGYALLGALAASVASFAHLLADHVAALRPLWVMAQLSILALGLMLLATGRLPQILQTVQMPLQKLSARLTAGRLGKWPAPLRAGLVGLCWAALPCAQLYAAVVLATLAPDAWGGAAVMAAYALPGVVSLWLGTHWLPRILGVRTGQTSLAANDGVATVRVWRDRNVARSLDQLVTSTWAVRVTGAVLAASAVLMLMHSTNKMIQLICG
jgi:sulfite exporter TauE/SafE